MKTTVLKICPTPILLQSGGAGSKSNLEDKLALAKKMAEKIAMKNNQKGAIQQSTESYLSGKGGSGGQPTLTAKTVADHLAKRLNAKLNYQPSEEAADSGIQNNTRIISFNPMWINFFK